VRCLEHRAVGERQRARHHVLQLAHVARPVVAREHGERGGIDAQHAPGVAHDRVDQQGKIVEARA
jgi:hypothetical protein